ncbi:MAG: hypothetical protein ABIU05_11870 [Nitrospirales bacterium]
MKTTDIHKTKGRNLSVPVNERWETGSPPTALSNPSMSRHEDLHGMTATRAYEPTANEGIGMDWGWTIGSVRNGRFSVRFRRSNRAVYRCA